MASTATKQAAPERITVSVDGREIDVQGSLPLRMGSWRKLYALGVDPVKAGAQGTADGELMRQLAYFAIQLAAPDATEQQLDDWLTLQDVNRIATAVMSGDAQGVSKSERPTSTPSSSSPNAGGGDRTTSPG